MPARPPDASIPASKLARFQGHSHAARSLRRSPPVGTAVSRTSRLARRWHWGLAFYVVERSTVTFLVPISNNRPTTEFEIRSETSFTMVLADNVALSDAGQ